MKSQELRASFVDYFVGQGHKHLASASLIPDAMSTTLFTIAGMEQFVPVFLGEVPPPAPRVVTVQRCLRVAGAKSDIENVGRTGRHGTFLEMLGNFSFGDYYKAEAIRYAWEFVTERLKLDRGKLRVTVHTTDDEAAALWEREIGLEPERISRFDDENFWTMGPTGPCGPSTEIFYDTGPENASGPDDTGPNRGNRYLEIWNIVFQQFHRDPGGKLNDLPRKAIDTGAGLERMLAVANGRASMYETDLFADLIAAQPPIAGTSLPAAEQLVRRRIIADHARAVTFLIADGVYPSNTDRGYVLRFLIRRAIRNGRLLGYPREFMPQLAAAVVASLAPGYPELPSRLNDVQNTLRLEERNFVRTLDRGSELLASLIDAAIADGTTRISGDRRIDEARQELAPAVERPHEVPLFEPQRVLDVVQTGRQFGITGCERRDDRRRELRHELARIAQEPAVAYRTPDQEAQNVPAVGIRRVDAVGDQERDRARMIGDDAPAHELLGRRETRSRNRRLRRDEIGEQVGLVHRGPPVGDREHPLETSPRIDRLARQVVQLPAGVAMELLKDDVPDLEVAVPAIGSRIVRPARVLRTGIVKDLGRRAARSRRPHRPKVLVVEAGDSLGLKADLPFPQCGRFVVGRMDGYREFAPIEFEALGHELPRVADRLGLVVVPETEVPEHLEERPVPARPPDVLDIAFRAGDPQAALHRHHPRRGRRDLAEKDRDELLHPGDREERRRHRVGDEGCGSQMLVSLPDEVVDERGAQLLRFHQVKPNV